MSEAYDLILRRVRPLGGQEVDLGIRSGLIAAIGARLAGVGPQYDGKGRDLIPGIHDHHIHLYATAARMTSIDLADCASEADVMLRLRAAAAKQRAPSWIRATGLAETGEHLPDRSALDRWISDRPLRIQDRTGALWLLNSAALAQLGSAPYPACVETSAQGVPTGRIWRGDSWLRNVIPANPPCLQPLSLALAAQGITAITDAGAANGPDEARLFETAIKAGALLQRLTVMGTESLPASAHFVRGPLKLLYDERDPADPLKIAERIRCARTQGRAVAAHCVTLAELLLYLEALDLAGGARLGDRVEHGSDIPADFIAALAMRGLTVVTQPDFIRSRGERYIADIPPDEWPNLYRLRSLIDAGITLRAGSDAPYGSHNPWQAMVSARTRKTVKGKPINPAECLSPDTIASVFGLRCQAAIGIGKPADLCLLASPLAEIMGVAADSPVDATFIAGTPIFER